MSGSNGWIRLYRELLDKAVWQLNDAQRIVFITILLSANHSERQWLWKGKQFSVMPGQFVTSLPNLAAKARTSEQSVRTALNNLKNLGFLTWESTATGRLITITNWGLYQSKEVESTDRSTVDSQPIPSLSPDGQQLTRIQECSNDEHLNLIVKEIQDNICQITNQIELDLIRDWTESVPRQWITEAIKIAALKKVRNLKYVDSILVSWAAKFKPEERPWEAQRRKENPDQSPKSHGQVRPGFWDPDPEDSEE